MGEKPPLLRNELYPAESPYSSDVFPKVSIVIPTSQSAHLIGQTLESLLSQDYPDFEVIVLDSASTDRTLEGVRAYRDARIKILSVVSLNRYEILNLGIAYAEGSYINFLFPGDFYLHGRVLRMMMELALEHHKPELVYCAAILSEEGEEMKVLYRPLTLSLLKLGRQPTNLQSCWIRLDTFQATGKFATIYQQRGGFEFLCRFCLTGNLRVASIYRAYTHYDLRGVGHKQVLRHFWETFLVVRKYFGWRAVFRWLFVQKDFRRFLRLWRRSLKSVFIRS